MFMHGRRPADSVGGQRNAGREEAVMLCALTVRTLEPGTFEEFRAAFTSGFEEDAAPEGWVRFDMLRNTARPEEVVCFGFYDGSVESLRSSEADQDYAAQMERIAPYVAGVGADGIYEVVDERVT
jgi:quinol monooxygenase YgiN